MAPATSQFLGGHGLGPPLLSPPPPPPQGCMPQHRHRLGYPIPHHGTRYLTLLQRSRVPACALTQHHGCVPWYQHRLGYLIPCHGTCYLTIPQRSRALFTCYYYLLNLLHLLHLIVAHHGIGIVLVTRFPATAPATSHFLGGCGLCSPTTTTSTSSTSRLRATASASALAPGSLLWYNLTPPRQLRAPVCAPTPHYGCTPWYRHRLD